MKGLAGVARLAAGLVSGVFGFPGRLGEFQSLLEPSMIGGGSIRGKISFPQILMRGSISAESFPWNHREIIWPVRITLKTHLVSEFA
jgi:hypothetical protein